MESSRCVPGTMWYPVPGRFVGVILFRLCARVSRVCPGSHRDTHETFYRVKSSLYINNRQPYGSLSNVLRRPAVVDLT